LQKKLQKIINKKSKKWRMNIQYNHIHNQN
jgi:hypothetical protein